MKKSTLLFPAALTLFVFMSAHAQTQIGVVGGINRATYGKILPVTKITNRF